MTTEERKEQIKKLYKSLSELPEEAMIKEFASLVYAKCAIQDIIETLKKNCDNAEDLAEKIKGNILLEGIVGAAAAYGDMGIEMGYACLNGGEDVCE